MRNLKLRSQQGVVIVVALFIMALVATMAYVMMSRLSRDTVRTRLILRDKQAEFYAQGSIVWAMEQLRNNWEKQKPNQIIDNIPIKSPVNEEQGYKIFSTIYDMQGRFNLNNLSNHDAQEDFKRLLQTVYPELNTEKAHEIIHAIVDWISPTSQQPEYNQYYQQLASPYRAAHRPLISVSELRLIKGVTPAILKAIEPYVTALPSTTLLNVQTAQAADFVTLSPTLTLAAGKAIEQIRAQSPFTTPQQFFNLDIVKNHHIPPDKITVSGNYFLVETIVEIEKQQVVIYTLLFRMTKAEKAAITIVWQNKGTQ